MTERVQVRQPVKRRNKRDEGTEEIDRCSKKTKEYSIEERGRAWKKKTSEEGYVKR